jgi:hypothetical protein
MIDPNLKHGIPLAKSKFTAVMIEEPWHDPEANFGLGAEGVFYYARALEWRIGAQGNTAEECRKNLKYVLIAQNMLMIEFPDSKPLPESEEEWQRVKTSGTHMVHTHPCWKDLMGYDRVKIIDRFEIDLDEGDWKVVKS